MPDVLSTTKSVAGGRTLPLAVSKDGRQDGTPDARHPVVLTFLPPRTRDQEERVGQTNLIVMFRECPFCGSTHRSPYVDELENAVMTCREKAQPDKRGDLDAWPESETLPVRCETEALSRAA